MVNIMESIMSRDLPISFAKLLKRHGICAQYTMPSIPHQNDATERRNRTLMEMVRRMTRYLDLPLYLCIHQGPLFVC